MKDGLTRGDLAFLRRTAMTGDHPWAVRVWAFIQSQDSRDERLQFSDAKWRAAQDEIERLRRHTEVLEERIAELNAILRGEMDR